MVKFGTEHDVVFQVGEHDSLKSCMLRVRVEISTREPQNFSLAKRRE